MVRSRWAVGVAIGLLVAVLAWVTRLLVGGRQVRARVPRARDRMAEGRYAAARERLELLAHWWPRDDEVAYLLGACEANLGRSEAALAAWGSVSSGSSLAGPARLAEGRLLVRSLGRLGDAERAYRSAARGVGDPAMQARWALAELMLWEGRLDEMRLARGREPRQPQIEERRLALRQPSENLAKPLLHEARPRLLR